MIKWLDSAGNFMEKEWKIFKYLMIKKAYKALDLGRGQGVVRFENGA
jgi:hypothetical protein